MKRVTKATSATPEADTVSRAEYNALRKENDRLKEDNELVTLINSNMVASVKDINAGYQKDIAKLDAKIETLTAQLKEAEAAGSGLELTTLRINCKQLLQRTEDQAAEITALHEQAMQYAAEIERLTPRRNARGAGRKPKPVHEAAAQVTQLHEAGRTIASIAEQTGLSVGTVHRIIHSQHEC